MINTCFWGPVGNNLTNIKISDGANEKSIELAEKTKNKETGPGKTPNFSRNGKCWIKGQENEMTTSFN